MRRILILFILVSFCAITPLVLVAQNLNEVYAYELEAEELIIDLRFEDAAERYIKAKKLFPESHNLTFMVGFCYLQSIESKHLALEYLQEAARHASPEYDPRSIRETHAPLEALYYLGRAYQIAYQFDQALEAYQDYLSVAPPDHNLIILANQQIQAIGAIPKFMNNANALEYSNLGEGINKSNPNINAVVSGDGQTLAFTVIVRNGFDIYVAKRDGDGWGRPRKINKDLRGRYYRTSSLSYDGSILFLTQDFGRGADIYMSVAEGRSWSRASKIKGDVNSRYNETHAVLSADGKTLYFTSDRPGGLGGLDIYKASEGRRGRWVDPVNLGPEVNTPLNEQTPFITEGNVLFFSSEGHNGLGGYDVFHVNLEGDRKPQNLGHPINTPDDDIFFQPEPNGRSGYMSFNRPDNIGPNDIHHIKIIPMVDVMGVVSADQPELINGVEFNVTLRDDRTGETLNQVSSQFFDPQQIHRLPPGSYSVTFANPDFEEYQSMFTIAEDYNLPEYVVNASVNPHKVLDEIPLALTEEDTAPATPVPTQQPDELLVYRDLDNQADLISSGKEVVLAEKQSEGAVNQPTKSSFAAEGDNAQVLLNTPLNGEGIYTVQFMALSKMSIANLQNVDRLVVITGDDGIVRYSSGLVSTMAEANDIKVELMANGHEDAFIRSVPLRDSFTIQVMALMFPQTVPSVTDMPNALVRKGTDNLYRYSLGSFCTAEEASAKLADVIKMGYSDAFITSMVQ